MGVNHDTGVTPSGSGHSPEGGAASSTASPAKPSVPNALREIVSGLSRYIGTFLPATTEYNAISEKGIARCILSGLAVALDSAASAIEARSDETRSGSAEGESAAPKEDAR